ncbi:hypothetical protein BDZ91DRAFT_646461, partial [Kalaharituber pfeilii]
KKMHELFAWLSPLEPQKRHQDVRATRLENTGNWFLQRREFQMWLNSTGDQPREFVLGCYGMPGAGKTVISSLVIDSLPVVAKQPGSALTYLYCDYRYQKEQLLVHIVGAFVQQL